MKSKVLLLITSLFTTAMLLPADGRTAREIKFDDCKAILIASCSAIKSDPSTSLQ